jgi:hypothetical protein
MVNALMHISPLSAGLAPTTYKSLVDVASLYRIESKQLPINIKFNKNFLERLSLTH